MCARGKGLLARSITRRQAAQHAQPPVDSFRFPPGVDDSASQGPMPTSARQPPGPGHAIHTVGADCISAQNRVHPTRKCGTGGHTGRPYGPAPGFQKMSLGRGTLFPGSASFDSTGFRIKRWWKFGRAYPRCGLDLCRGVRYNNVSFDELCQFIWGAEI